MDNEAVALAAAAGDGDPRTGLRAAAALRKLTDQLERAQVRCARLSCAAGFLPVPQRLAPGRASN